MKLRREHVNSVTVEANGVALGVEHFGDAAAPLVLLAGGTTMLSWPDPLCEALARGGSHVHAPGARGARQPGPVLPCR